MQIKIKQIAGPEHVMDVQLDQLVSDLKALICDKIDGLNIESQKLVYKGHIMQDKEQLGFYNLQQDCRINLFISHKKLATEQRVPPLQSSQTNQRHPFDDVDAPGNNNDEDDDFERDEDLAELDEPERLPRNAIPLLRDGATEAETKFAHVLLEKFERHQSSPLVHCIIRRMISSIRSELVTLSLDDLERFAKEKINVNNN